MDKNIKKIQLLTIDEIASIIFIGLVLISILVTENEKNKLKNKKSYDTYNIEIINKVIGSIILLIFLFLSIENYNIAINDNKDLKPYKLQIIASIFALIAGLIVLYIVYYNHNINLSDFDNPEL